MRKRACFPRLTLTEAEEFAGDMGSICGGGSAVNGIWLRDGEVLLALGGLRAGLKGMPFMDTVGLWDASPLVGRAWGLLASMLPLVLP